MVDVRQLRVCTAAHCGYWRSRRPARGKLLSRAPKALAEEEAAGLHTLAGHAGFSGAVLQVKRDLLEMLIDASRKGLSVAGYGAPGKGNTLLNHCGIRSDLLAYTVDRNPYKHGRYLPGRISRYSPGGYLETRPDLVLVLPWNLRDEIIEQLAYIREWGGKLITIPHTAADGQLSVARRTR